MRDTEETSAKQRYDSDVTDTEWDILGPVIESCQYQRRGRPLATDLREVLNAIFYLNKTGCPWRYLPKDFPDYRTVNYHYLKFPTFACFRTLAPTNMAPNISIH